MSDVEDQTRELQELTKELRDTLESKKAESAESKEKIEKIENALVKHDETNQKITLELAEANKKANEFKEYCEKLEKHLNAPGNNFADKEEKAAWSKALTKYAQHGKENLSEEELKYLRTDNNPSGGYQITPEVETSIMKKITEISLVRSVATVKSTRSNRVELPLRASSVTAFYAGEAEPYTESQSKYGKENIYIKKLVGKVRLTQEDIEDNDFDILEEVDSDMAEAMAQREGRAFVKGLGVPNEPEGFMTNANVPILKSGKADDFDWDNLIDMQSALKTGYNPMYGLNRRALGRVRKLKDGNGDYLWVAGNLAAGIPNAINGSAYIELPDMDDIGADTFPVIYADFARGYEIRDRVGILMKRDDNTEGDSGIVIVRFYQRHGAKVKLPEAFVKLQCKV
jgi:HK97 family phage major capsid protein